MKLQQLSLSDLYGLRDSLIKKLDDLTLSDIESLKNIDIIFFTEKDADVVLIGYNGKEVTNKNSPEMVTLRFCFEEIKTREDAIIQEVTEAPIKDNLIGQIIDNGTDIDCDVIVFLKSAGISQKEIERFKILVLKKFPQTEFIYKFKYISDDLSVIPFNKQELPMVGYFFNLSKGKENA